MLITLLSLFACKSCHDNQIINQDKIQEDSGLGNAFDNDWGSWLAMDLLSDGTTAIAYYDKTDGGIGYATEVDSEWIHEPVDGYKDDQGLDQGDRGKYIDMVVASGDVVWLSYYDINLKNLRYATYDPSTSEWTNGLADSGGGSSPDAGLFTSIALDSSQNPVIAHYDQYKGELRVATWNGSAFDGTVVDEGEDAVDVNGETVDSNTGAFTSIAIDGGTTYISYYDQAAGDLRLAINDGSGWTMEVVDSEGDVGQWSSLLVESGSAHIAYHDVSNQNLKYASGTSGNFTIETVDEAPYSGADTDLIKIGDDIHIVYFDGQNNDLKLASLVGGEWSTETVAGEDSAVGYHNELVNKNGAPYVGCYNFTSQTPWFSSL